MQNILICKTRRTNEDLIVKSYNEVNFKNLKHVGNMLFFKLNFTWLKHFLQVSFQHENKVHTFIFKFHDDSITKEINLSRTTVLFISMQKSLCEANSCCFLILPLWPQKKEWPGKQIKKLFTLLERPIQTLFKNIKCVNICWLRFFHFCPWSGPLCAGEKSLAGAQELKKSVA